MVISIFNFWLYVQWNSNNSNTVSSCHILLWKPFSSNGSILNSNLLRHLDFTVPYVNFVFFILYLIINLHRIGYVALYDVCHFLSSMLWYIQYKQVTQCLCISPRHNTTDNTSQYYKSHLDAYLIHWLFNSNWKKKLYVNQWHSASHW